MSLLILLATLLIYEQSDSGTIHKCEIDANGSIQSSSIRLPSATKTVRVCLNDPNEYFAECRKVVAVCGCNRVNHVSLSKDGSGLATFEIDLSSNESDSYRKVDLTVEVVSHTGETISTGAAFEIIVGCPILPPVSVRNDFTSKQFKLTFANRGLEKWQGLFFEPLFGADVTIAKIEDADVETWDVSIPWDQIPKTEVALDMTARVTTDSQRQLVSNQRVSLPSRKPFRWVTSSCTISMRGDNRTIIAILVRASEDAPLPQLSMVSDLPHCQASLKSAIAKGSVCIFRDRTT
jgi:hypothetical protein